MSNTSMPTKWSQLPPEVYANGECYSTRLLEKQYVDAVGNLAELTAAISRGGYDISVCMTCGLPVVCIPDGLPMCEGCALKEGAKQ